METVYAPNNHFRRHLFSQTHNKILLLVQKIRKNASRMIRNVLSQQLLREFLPKNFPLQSNGQATAVLQN